MVDIGNITGLRFTLSWDRGDPQGSADEATWGTIIAAIGDAEVWRSETGSLLGGVHWALIEMLEHLAWTWRFLVNEEMDPLGLALQPDQIRSEAVKRWDTLPESQRIGEQRAIKAYEESHDLARAFQGLWVPSLWVQRQGNKAWLISGTTVDCLPFTGVIAALERLGDMISDRVSSLSDERATAARQAWSRRDSIDLEERIAT